MVRWTQFVPGEPLLGELQRIHGANRGTKYPPRNEPDGTRPDFPPTPEADMQGIPEDDALLTPSEVAAMFRVNPKTVTRWARAGKISAIRTLGGHRRFRAAEIRSFLEKVEEHTEL